MKTEDQILKIRAAVLYILSRYKEGIDYIKLYKILYFAQRQHLVEYGVPILDINFQARKKGPVSGFVGSAIKSVNKEKKIPNEFRLMADGIRINVRMIKDVPVDWIVTSENPDMDELSVSNVKCLDRYIDKFYDMESEDVSKLSHEDKAWQKAWSRSKTDPQQRYMTMLEIAEAGGATTDTLSYIRQNLELDELLKY